MSSRISWLSVFSLAILTQFPAHAVNKSAAAEATAALSKTSEPAVAASVQAEKLFTQAELDQMLAPIALYPDTVLSHVLIAATYPLEIVKATRWLSGKPAMTSEEALKAAENEDWDPSVRALVAFPPLLTQMNNDLEWTQQLGDAFLTQESQVMDTVQQLREKAYANGNLLQQDQIRVERKEKVIVIEPAQPEVVYVPVYDTRVVYGDWWWREYPPVHWPYPAGYHSSSSFYWGLSARVAPGFYFSTFYWPRREVVVIHHHHRPSRYYHSYDIIRHEERRHWRHNPVHRRGVEYRGSYRPVREIQGPQPRYERHDDKRRWAAERRVENRVDFPADRQMIRREDRERGQLQRPQREDGAHQQTREWRHNRPHNEQTLPGGQPQTPAIDPGVSPREGLRHRPNRDEMADPRSREVKASREDWQEQRRQRAEMRQGNGRDQAIGGNERPAVDRSYRRAEPQMQPGAQPTYQVPVSQPDRGYRGNEPRNPQVPAYQPRQVDRSYQRSEPVSMPRNEPSYQRPQPAMQPQMQPQPRIERSFQRQEMSRPVERPGAVREHNPQPQEAQVIE